MEAIVFIGIQATGKSTYYTQRFMNTHVRISMDLLKTRNRERIFLDACLKTQAKFVVDNTNPSASDRAVYISAAKERKYRVVGYYFGTSLATSLERNALRTGKARIPDSGVRSCFSKLELPSLAEGFDELYYVKLEKEGFTVQPWNDEI